jgi:hypothetical protein
VSDPVVNTPIKDILARLRGTPTFEIPSDTPSDYADHMTAEVKRSVVNKQTGEVPTRWGRIGARMNHLFDAECLQVLAALIVRTLPLKEQETAPGVVTETVEL